MPEYEVDERVIIATKAGAKSSSTVGVVNAIAEEVDGKLIPITSEGFCPTRQVFIVGGYEDIDEKFKDGELFKIRVDLNQVNSNLPNQCTYKSYSKAAIKLQPNEVVEIIKSELPDPNERYIYHSDEPCTKYILIQDSIGDCYGPFDWKSKDENGNEICIEIEIIKGGRLGEAGRTNQIHKINRQTAEANLVTVDSPRGKITVAKDVSSIPRDGYIDYASDKEVISYVSALAKDKAGKRIDRNSFFSISARAKGATGSATLFNKNRIERFTEIINTNADFADEVNELLTTFLNNNEGKKVLDRFVNENRSKYIDQLRSETDFQLTEEIKKKQESLQQLVIDIDNLQKQITQMRDDHIAEKKKFESEAAQKAFSEAASEKHQKRMAEMAESEALYKQQIEAIRSQYEKYKKVEDIENQLTRTEHRLEIKKDELLAEKSALEELRQETLKTDQALRNKLATLKPYVDYYNGTQVSDETAASSIEAICASLPTDQEQIHKQRAIIRSVQSYLADKGRFMPDKDVANFLISTQQSFITFFAGLPGVGKTSTCEFLTEAQRLKSRSLKVSVARGWTSLRDIVGFHNPLTQSFQRAPTRMYDFLRSLDIECDKEAPNAMSYVLLDEANLSPIEHYWSEFMGKADGFEGNTLALGVNTLRLPAGMRFLATVNYDGTTETLSPRILDRASVIVMSSNDSNEIGHSDDDGLVPMQAVQSLPISYEDMHSLFGQEASIPKLEVAESGAFDEISEILSMPSADQGRGISISLRKRNAIHQYCNRARPFMNDESNKVVALDYAVKQHVLPMISGHGEKFGKRLISLKKTAYDHGLDMSAAYLDQIISYGENDLHSYEFFCW